MKTNTLGIYLHILLKMSAAGNVDVGETDKQVIPDSTTKERDNTTKEQINFSEGEDVLVMQKDGRFYLGTVVEICSESEKCLVKFGDGTERWSVFKDITRLSVPEADAVMCVVCKSSQIKPENDIIVCEKCARGYHQKCHEPFVESGEMDWRCYRCQCNKNCQLSMVTQKTVSSTSKDCSLPQNSDDLPYDLNELVWDIEHTMNTSQQYCYCGKTGDWFVKMIQCGRCLQWFHEKCVHCLLYPLHLGDRFYVFVCSICNLGAEFVRRLEMKWVDMVHLVIFNLIAYRAKRYYDLDSEIVKYINSHWNTLQLPPKIFNTTMEERKNNVLAVLSKNRHRFKCCYQLKKHAIWGLRKRGPPSPPSFTLPSNSFPLTDKLLKNLWSDNKRLRFFSVDNFYVSNIKRLHVPNGLKPSEAGLKLLRIANTPLLLPKGMPATGHKVCIKSATPSHVDRSTIERRIFRQQEIEHRRLRNLNSRRNSNVINNSQLPELPPTPPSSISAPETPQTLSSVTNGDPPTPPAEDTSGEETFDSFITNNNNSSKNIINIEKLFCSIKEEIKPHITLPLPLKNVITDRIVRSTKRRLSEKDIIVTENGEVKRRRMRRQNSFLGSKVKSNSFCQPSTSKKCIEQVGHSTLVTPVKASYATSSSSINDLKSSVYSYFGTATRIAAGEEYTVLGKRITMDGNVQYLIEWKNSHLL